MDGIKWCVWVGSLPFSVPYPAQQMQRRPRPKNGKGLPKLPHFDTVLIQPGDKMGPKEETRRRGRHPRPARSPRGARSFCPGRRRPPEPGGRDGEPRRPSEGRLRRTASSHRAPLLGAWGLRGGTGLLVTSFTATGGALPCLRPSGEPRSALRCRKGPSCGMEKEAGGSTGFCRWVLVNLVRFIQVTRFFEGSWQILTVVNKIFLTLENAVLRTM